MWADRPSQSQSRSSERRLPSRKPVPPSPSSLQDQSAQHRQACPQTGKLGIIMAQCRFNYSSGILAFIVW